jgi:cob(I)alamin adenosyltransferase
MAAHHVRAWEWFEGVEPGVKPPALIECWFRGCGKSTTVELALARMAVRAERRFALYVSATQQAANRHVQATAATMERVGVERAVNKYGYSKGWTADLLRTANGFNILSLGLDAAVRGIKLDAFRPDVIVLDDIDELGDSIESVADKVAILTQSILPAGSVDVAVAFVQNAIHIHSIMSGSNRV